MTNFVQWYLDGSGYRVTAYNSECQPIEEYSAGDHPLDSQTVAENDHKLPKRTLIKFAKQTAKEMADKHKIPHSRISRDTDSEADAMEDLQSRK